MNNPLHTLDISGDLNVVGNVTVNSVNATESFNYIAPIEQLQNVNEEPSWTGNVSTSIGFDELIDGNIPESLDTLKEIAQVVKDISNSDALEAGLGLKANKHSPIFTGNVGIGQVANVSYALDISGDVNISSGALKLNGQTPVYSNWTVNGNDIYRPSGNVGIGMTIPSAKLNIKTPGSGTRDAPNNATGKALSIDDGNNGLYLNIGTSSNGTTAAFGLNWYNSGSHTDVDNVLVLKNVDGENRVGIGTTSPQSLLHLAGTGDVVLRLQADTDNSDEGDNPMIEFRQDGNLLTGLIGTGNLPTGAGVNDNAMYIQHCGETGIVFLSGPNQDNQSTSVERMRITNSGNVGIGTMEPLSKLSVGEDGNCVLTIENTTESITGARTIGEICWRGQWISGNTSSKLYMGKIKVGAVGGSGTTGSYMSFHNSNGQERMRLDENGNVGIGTTSQIINYILLMKH